MIVERPMLERRVMASLDAGRIPVVLGGCGVGRTSLLLRLEQLIGRDRSQYLDLAAAATTPERCLAAIQRASRMSPARSPVAPASAREAFDALLAFFDEARTPSGAQATFLIDEILDIRTFESFPGLRHIQREIVARLAASPSRFVLASRFTSRVHRLLRDAPARFEVVHLPGLGPAEVQVLAGMLDGESQIATSDAAPMVATLTNGRAADVVLLLDALASMGGPAIDPVAALASLFAPGGRMTARCRESYEFRLQRARGYGALKAILSVLAQDEPLNLTEISHALHRTPGSTKDYLSWLEDVDLVAVQGKRYSFADPLLRVYVRLYGRPTPPTDDDIVREVGNYAKQRLPRAPEPATVAVTPSGGGDSSDPDEVPPSGRDSGIIEID